MILNFTIDSEPQYSLLCINQSTSSWYFYIYQRVPEQATNNIFSLVWMTSPYKISHNSYVVFQWSTNLCFVWLYTGELQVGVSPNIGGTALAEKNGTTFNKFDNTPQFSDFVSSNPPNEFSITGGITIPNKIFSTGLGMSGFGILVQQSYINIVQDFTCNTTFWVAVTNSYIQVSDVLSQNIISNSASFSFPLNIYEMTATLGENNLWCIKKSIFLQ